MTSPEPIAAPSATFRAVTLPERWAVISFSIFIASITQIRSPSATSAPSATATLRTVPCSGEGSASLEAAAPPPPAALAFRRFAAARGGSRGAGDGLADHLDVEELARDLDLVVAGDDLGALLRGLRRGDRLGRGRLQPVGVLHQVAAGLAVGPLLGAQDRLVEGDQRRAGRRSRIRRAPAACAASLSRGRRPRRSSLATIGSYIGVTSPPPSTPESTRTPGPEGSR